MAHGSLREVETQVLIAERLNYLDGIQRADLIEACAEVGRLINGLSNSLAKREQDLR